MSIILICVTIFAIAFGYVWLECRMEHNESAAGFDWRLSLWLEWQEWCGGRRLIITVQHRRLLIVLGGYGGSRISWEQQCPDCGEWHQAWYIVKNVWGYQVCIDCADHAAYVFHQVCDHYGYPPKPVNGAWIPVELQEGYVASGAGIILGHCIFATIL